MNKLFACHLLTFQNVKTISASNIYKYVEYSVNLWIQDVKRIEIQFGHLNWDFFQFPHVLIDIKYAIVWLKIENHVKYSKIYFSIFFTLIIKFDIQNRLHPTLTEKKRDINFIDTTRRPGTSQNSGSKFSRYLLSFSLN